MKKSDVDAVIDAVKEELDPVERRLAAAELKLAKAEASLVALAQATTRGLSAVARPGGGTTPAQAEKTANSMVEVVRAYFRRSTSALIERVAALEARTALFDAGVWSSSKAYSAGAAVTHGGSLWIAQRTVLPGERPGDGSGAYRLAVKKGSAS